MTWWQRLVHRNRAERQLDAELSFHFDRLVADYRSQGMPEREARRRARLEFGGMDQVKEACRDVRGTAWVEASWQDIRLTFRALRRTPGFAAAAICTLALGIGANTAIFSVVYAVLLKPLPYANAAELVAISAFMPQTQARFPSLPVRAVDFIEFRRSNSVFTAMSAVAGTELNLTGAGEPERLYGARVSSNFFEMVGVMPERGRTFDEEEDLPGRDRVVIISHELWMRRFGSDPQVLNRLVSLDDQSYSVVGVMPAGFLFPTGSQLHPLLPLGPRVDIWKPMAFSKEEISSEGSWDYGVIARLRRGVSAQVAQQQMDAMTERISERVRRAAQIADLDIRTRLVPIRDIFSGNLRRELLALVGAVALLLLIACANLANLLLARLSSRSRELATRIALGASRSRLVRQLLTESAVIAALGGAVGLLVALWGTRLLASLGPSDAPALQDTPLNAPVLAFTMMAALVTAVVFGLVPALVSGRSDPHKDLRDGARGLTSGAQGGRLRRVLVASEVALCSSLMVVAVLLLHSFINVLNVDKGFVAERVLSVDLSLSARSYAPAQVPHFYQALVERARTLPGVTSAGAVTMLPLLGESNTRAVRLESDTDYTHDLERPVAVARTVTAGYFDTMGIQLVAGRLFVEQEPHPTAIISRRLARGLWPDQSFASSIGRRIRPGDLGTPLLTIVGVVADVRSGALDREPMPAIYRPHTQTTSRDMTLVIRTSGEPLALASAIRAEVKRLDGKLPVPTARTLDEIIAHSVATRRFQMALTVLFALVSLALGAVGVYGVTSYAVAQQTREIGVRMALGAQRFEVLRQVLVQGLRPVLLGLMVGVAGAIAGARSVRSFLFGIGPLDPWALFTGCGMLLVAAIIACYLPAKRASLVDPVTALRSE